MKAFARAPNFHPNPSAETAAVRAKRNGGADAGPLLKNIAHVTVIVLGGVAFAYFARSVVFPLLLAWIAAMTLKPPVAWLRHHHFPALLAAAIVLGFFIFVAGLGVTWLGGPTADWIKSAPEKVTQLKAKYGDALQPVFHFSSVVSSLGNLESSPGATNAAPSVAVTENHFIGTMFNWTGDLLAGIGGAVVLTFLFLAETDSFLQKMAEFLPGRRPKERAVVITREIQHQVSSYLSTVSLINAGLGAAVGISFWLLGLPNAAMWGAVVALLNFLPFFGPTVGIVLVGLAGLLAFDTPARALFPVGAYLLLHLTESYFLTPLALGQRFSLNRVVIFVAFIFCAWLWGVFGALLAVPLLVSLKAACERVPAWRPAAEFLSP
jgi:predicted PurR-regulated permease PerM